MKHVRNHDIILGICFDAKLDRKYLGNEVLDMHAQLDKRDHDMHNVIRILHPICPFMKLCMFVCSIN